MARTSSTAGRRLTAREREQKAVQLRRAGMSYDAIAKSLACTRSAAFKAVGRVFTRLAREAREDAAGLRELEVQRLDALLVAVWPAAAKGDLGAVDRALRIAERRAKLLGLDEPVKTQIGALPTIWDVQRLVFKQPPADQEAGENAGLDEDEPAHNGRPGWKFDPAADVAEMRRKGELPPA